MSFDPTQLRSLVERSLEEVGPELASPQAVDLVLGTIAVESKFGTYIRQVGGGPALGICQIEPATYEDLWDSWIYYQTNGLGGVLEELGHKRDFASLEWDIRHSIVMCRLLYRRIPEALPEHGNLAGYAEYWKKYYNTPLGKGTVAKFLFSWQQFLDTGR